MVISFRGHFLWLKITFTDCFIRVAVWLFFFIPKLCDWTLNLIWSSARLLKHRDPQMGSLWSFQQQGLKDKSDPAFATRAATYEMRGWNLALSSILKDVLQRIDFFFFNGHFMVVLLHFSFGFIVFISFTHSFCLYLLWDTPSTVCGKSYINKAHYWCPQSSKYIFAVLSLGIHLSLLGILGGESDNSTAIFHVIFNFHIAG